MHVYLDCLLNNKHCLDASIMLLLRLLFPEHTVYLTALCMEHTFSVIPAVLCSVLSSYNQRLQIWVFSSLY